MRRQAFSVEASTLKKTGAACIAASLNVGCFPMAIPPAIVFCGKHSTAMIFEQNCPILSALSRTRKKFRESLGGSPLPPNGVLKLTEEESAARRRYRRPPPSSGLERKFLQSKEAFPFGAVYVSFAALMPASRPNTMQSAVALPPRRFVPWTPPVTSPAA